MISDALLSALGSLVDIAAPLVSLVIAVLALIYGVRQHRNGRETLIVHMREKWSSLQSSWAEMLMVYAGPDFYYADATPEEREAVKITYSSILHSEDVNPTNFDYTKTQGAEQRLRATSAPVLSFLAYAADSVLRGKWTISEAYEVFGPELLRHHLMLRVLARKDSDYYGHLSQVASWNNFDQQDALYLLAVLLRVESCRRGDTYPHFTVELAKEMRHLERNRIRASVWRVKKVRHRLFLPMGVRLLLWRGRHPKLVSAYGISEDPIVEEYDERLFSRPFEPRWMLKRRIKMARRRSIETPDVVNSHSNGC